MSENMLAADEAKRVSQHEAVKGAVRDEVNAKIESDANQFNTGEQAKLDSVANNLKQKSIADIGRAESELERARSSARVSQIIDYVFLLIYGILTLEIVLAMIGASNANGFKRF